MSGILFTCCGDTSATFSDLNERVEGLLLVVLGDDFCQEDVLALGQLDEGADAVHVGVDLDVQDVVLP